MSILIINTGATANDHTGDVLRVAFTKINDNFATLESEIANCMVIGATVSIAQVDGLQAIIDDINSQIAILPTLTDDVTNINIAISSINDTLTQINDDLNTLYDNVSSLNTTVSNNFAYLNLVKLNDAPSDGSTYARRDGDWVQVSGSTGSAGVQGPRGFQGTQGANGAQGLRGFQGDRGFQGNVGSTGSNGVQGRQGPQGLRGFQGLDGQDGLNGNQGPQGLVGQTGVQGSKGFQGEQGFQGSQGNVGANGVQGRQGPQGLRGFQGLDGQDGLNGNQGPQGSAGSNGNQGAQGLRGFQGDRGFQGNVGANGVQGNQGAVGDNGTQGLRGFQGDRGFQGSQGRQGITGAQGNQGAVGNTGFQGNQGIIGSTGSQGPQGRQGVQGFIGSTGSQGSIGPQGLIGITGAGVQGSQGPQGLLADMTRSSNSSVSVSNGSKSFTFTIPSTNLGWVVGSRIRAVATIDNITFVSGLITTLSSNTVSINVDNFFDSTGSGSYSTWNLAITGELGVQGTQGLRGFQGLIGATGIQGFQGSYGFQGITGAGFQGPQGFAGSTGANGVQGNQGPIGLTGAGFQGAQGPQGFQGSTGADGVSISYYNYKARTTTQSPPPSDNQLIWNNATQISATELYISHLTVNNIDIDVFLSLIKVGDKLIIQDANNSANYQQWTVSATTTIVPNNYITIPVTYVNGGYSFSNSHDIILIPLSIGIQGPQGQTGNQGPQGFQGQTGPQGSAGSTGSQGFQGLIGFQGNQGLIGSTGSQGPQGSAGSNGNQGAQGPQGQTGSTGSDGPNTIRLSFAGSTAGNNPTGNGQFNTANGLTLSSVTGISFNTLVTDINSSSIAGWLSNLLTDKSNGRAITAQLSELGNPSIYGIYTAVPITPSPNFAWTLTFVSGTGSLTNGRTYTLSTVSGGATGPQGWQGVQGPQGRQGWQGFQGIQGVQGPQGRQGWQGPIGLTGSGFQGPQGFQGSTGSVTLATDFSVIDDLKAPTTKAAQNQFPISTFTGEPGASQNVAAGYTVGKSRVINTNDQVEWLYTSGSSTAVWEPIGTVDFVFKLTPAQIMNGSPITIPGLTAPGTEFGWVVTECSASNRFDTLAYDGTPNLFIIAAGTGDGQYFADTAFMTSDADPWGKLVDLSTQSNTVLGNIVVNAPMQVLVTNPPTVGDGIITIWGSAKKIRYIVS